MKTPFFGGFYISHSLNLADQKCINLYPSQVDTKTGKDVGALYLTPGLDLLSVAGNGPIRGSLPFNNSLIVVSRNAVYAISTAFIATLIGTIGTSAGPVTIITNGTNGAPGKQLVIFDGVSAYLLPGGNPLTGGAVADGGADYVVGDTLYLQAADGVQSASAEITVTVVSGGAITGFIVTIPGAFNPNPTTFTQASTSGSGTGFSLNAPTFGAFVPIYTVPLPFTGPVSASYQDGFGLVNQSGTDIWWQSNVFDLSIWDPLSFSSADAAPDDIVAIAELHEEQFLFKQTNTEVWINAGQPGFAFQRLAGVHIEMGCAAPFSPAKAGESLIWLAMNEQGQGTVHQIVGYEPRKISTKAIDGAIQSYSVISDAIGFAYQQNGHLFYQLTFPTANATWVYDVSIGLWHSRAAFSNGSFSRHWANSYSFFNGKCIIGDYRNGNLYAFNTNTLTDNGTPKKWVRSWRALAQPVFQPTTFSSLQIDMQTGINVPQGTNPQVVLRWSDDGGHNWSDERIQSAGKSGETALRVIFKRLGSTRLNSGLDRIFELSGTDVMPVALIGADLQ